MRAKPRLSLGQRRFARSLEIVLLLVAIGSGMCVGAAWLQARTADAASFQIAPPQPSSEWAEVGAIDPSKVATLGKTIGRITIPVLGLSAPITNGIGKLELMRGVGWIPGTAQAGGLGTMALAGHRDTFFRGLRNISPGMQISVSGQSGLYKYSVDATKVVDPDQVEVLEIGSDPALVLVTCYPFNYIGSAPKRFIVHARLLSAAPEMTN